MKTIWNSKQTGICFVIRVTANEFEASEQLKGYSRPKTSVAQMKDIYALTSE